MKVPKTTKDMFPGILGELIEGTTQVTEAHPAAVAGQFLVGLGNAIGRDAHTYVGETRHGLNENMLIVGPTATGRKGDAWNVARIAIAAADPAWVDLIASRLQAADRARGGAVHEGRRDRRAAALRGAALVAPDDLAGHP